MSKRTCQIALRIDNGVTRFYRLTPLKNNDLPNPFVAGFRLARIRVGFEHDEASDLYDLDIDDGGCSAMPVYFVRLALDGAVNCSCPQWQNTERCKHADALTAAGLLPVDMVRLLAARSILLDEAEKKLAEATKKTTRKRKTG